VEEDGENLTTSFIHTKSHSWLKIMMPTFALLKKEQKNRWYKKERKLEKIERRK
jgi:hypothetical protein